jgi:hypothetical protein
MTEAKFEKALKLMEEMVYYNRKIVDMEEIIQTDTEMRVACQNVNAHTCGLDKDDAEILLMRWESNVRACESALRVL